MILIYYIRFFLELKIFNKKIVKKNMMNKKMEKIFKIL